MTATFAKTPLTREELEMAQDCLKGKPCALTCNRAHDAGRDDLIRKGPVGSDVCCCSLNLSEQQAPKEVRSRLRPAGSTRGRATGDRQLAVRHKETAEEACGPWH